MLREQKIKNVTWISAAKPEAEDLRVLKERFPEIHPLVLEDLETPTIRPRVENYDHHLYMVLHFPKFVPGPEKSITYEMDFILMPEVLVTVQYDEISIVEEFWHECESKDLAAERYGKTPVHLLYYLLGRFFAHALRELDKIQVEVDNLEGQVFQSSTKELLEDITILKRDVLDFRRAFKPQHLTLNSLISPAIQLYGERTRPFLNDLLGEYLKVWNLLETHKEALDALYETTNSLLAAKTNEVMKAFTILAFITFIPTAIANIYGMNVDNMPLADRPDAFLAIIFLMLGATGLVYVILRLKKLI